MKWYRIIMTGLLIFLLASCTKDQSTPINTIASSTQFNVSYGDNPLQKMDVFLPADRSAATTKVLILIHGGAWTSGDKDDLKSYVDSFKTRLPGYAIFNINYRLSSKPTNVFPTQENDVKAAIDFIYSKSEAFLISDIYVLAGESAGAHLAMLQGFKQSLPVKPKVIASFSGPSDLIEMYHNPVAGNTLISRALADAVGTSPDKDSLIYATSSPVNFIATTSPPTIIFQAGIDPLVSVAQAVEVQKKLADNGIKNQYVFYPFAAHIGTWDNATMFDAFNKLQAFIEANAL